MKIQTRSGALLTAMVALLVAGGSTGTAMAKQTKITAMVATFDGLTAKLLNQIARNYEAKHPDVKVAMAPTGWSGEAGWSEKLSTLAAAGSLPDVFYMRSAIIPWFSGSRGLMEPLDKYIAAEKLDRAQWPKWAFAACSYNGQTLGLPYTAEMQWVFYNVDNIAQAGLTDLETLYASGGWDYDALASVATKANRVVNGKVEMPGLSYTFTNTYQHPGWAWGFGGEIWSEAGNKCLVDSPAAMEGWRFLYDLVYRKGSLFDLGGGMPPVKGASGANVGAGKFGMHLWLDGYLGVWDSAKAKFKLNMVPFPKGPKSDENILASSEILSVSKSSKNKKAAYDFARYLASDEALSILVTEHGSFAPKRSAANLWAKTQVQKGRTGARYIQEVLDRSRPFPKLARYASAEVALDPFWLKAWQGKVELQQAMKQGAIEANKWLSRK